MDQRRLNHILIISVAYVAAQMMADVTSLRMVSIAGLSVDAGTLIYPITFTLRDLIHKIAGIQTARVLIVTAAVVNIVMALLFFVAGRLPPAPDVGEQLEFVTVLSPVWRIVVASIVAEIISELVDGEIYQKWVNHFAGKWQWGRVFSSNAVAIPVDSLIFCAIAFVGVFPLAVVFEIFTTNILIKGLTTLFSLPLIYMVKPKPPNAVEITV